MVMIAATVMDKDMVNVMVMEATVRWVGHGCAMPTFHAGHSLHFSCDRASKLVPEGWKTARGIYTLRLCPGESLTVSIRSIMSTGMGVGRASTPTSTSVGVLYFRVCLQQ